MDEKYAVQAVCKGEASPEMQKTAFDVICKKICRLGFSPHIAGDPYTTAFNAGLQKAAQIMVYIASVQFEDNRKRKK